MSKFIKISGVQYEDGVDSSEFPSMFFVEVEDDTTEGDIDNECGNKIAELTGHCQDGYLWEIMHPTSKTLLLALDAAISEARKSWRLEEVHQGKVHLEAAEDVRFSFANGRLKTTTALIALQNMIEVLEQLNLKDPSVLNLCHMTLHLFDSNRTIPSMTYRQLQDVLNRLPDERLDDSVTILTHGEYFGATSFIMDQNDNDSDTIEPGTLVLASITANEV